MPYGIPRLEVNWKKIPWNLGHTLSQGEKMLPVVFFRVICLWPDTVAPTETPVQALPCSIPSPHNPPLGHVLVCTTPHRQIILHINCVSCLFYYCSTQCTHILIFYILFSTLPRYAMKGLFKSYMTEEASLLLCNSVLLPYMFITQTESDSILLKNSILWNKVFLRLKSNKKKDIWEDTDWDLGSLIYFQTSYKNRINLSLCPLIMQTLSLSPKKNPTKTNRKPNQWLHQTLSEESHLNAKYSDEDFSKAVEVFITVSTARKEEHASHGTSLDDIWIQSTASW